MMKPNIIFILIDALRAQNLGCYDKGKNFSPHIDTLAQRGVLFENCFSGVNASDPALTTVMSGRYPRSHGIVHHSFDVSPKELQVFEERKVKLLQEVLRDAGYHTAGLDFLGRWHQRGYDYYTPLKIDRTKRKKQLYYLSKTFEVLRIKPLFKKLYATKFAKKIVGGFDSYPKDSETTQKAIELLKENNEPFFLFVHYWGVHKPYTCPAVANKLSVDCYENAVQTVDEQVGKILSAIDEKTIIILMADHGESLGEHGIAFDHHGLYDASLHVPLIIAGGGLPMGKRIPALCSIVDVFPTVLELAGAEDNQKIDGESLRPVIEETAPEIRDLVFAEENYYQEKAAVRTKEHKLIKRIGKGVCGKCQIVHGGEVELYDLKDDPRELHNIADTETEITARLTKKLEEFLAL